MKNIIKIVSIFIILIIPVSVNAAVYYPADSHGNGKTETSYSKVKTSVTSGKLVIEYYDFKERHGSGNHEVSFGVASAVKAKPDKDGYKEGFHVSNPMPGSGDILIWGKATDSVCLTKTNGSCDYKAGWYMYKSGELPSSATVAYNKMKIYDDWQGVNHVHYKRLVVDNSTVCSNPSKIKYVTLGTGIDIWDYKSIGCTPVCEYSKCDCKTYGTKSDASCGCKTYNTCDDTSNCLSWDTKDDNNQKQYQLKGTDVSTGKEIVTTNCTGSTCTF